MQKSPLWKCATTVLYCNKYCIAITFHIRTNNMQRAHMGWWNRGIAMWLNVTFLGSGEKKLAGGDIKEQRVLCNPNVHWMPHKEHPSLHSWQKATREIPKSTMFSPPKSRSCVLLFWPCPQRRWGGLVKKTSKGPPSPICFLVNRNNTKFSWKIPSPTRTVK